MTWAQRLTVRIDGGKWHGAYGTARCPAHDDGVPSLTLRDGDRGILLKCHAGCPTEAVIAALRRQGLWLIKPRGHLNSSQTQPPGVPLDVVWAIWRGSQRIAGTPAERYLRYRGIRGAPPPSLRYHAGLRHSETGLVLPAMVGAVQGPDGAICGLHRTFLRADGAGKAPVTSPRKMLGQLGGRAVRLAVAGAELAIGEGIETCLAYQEATGTPTWAALSTGGMRSVVLPPLPLAAIVYVVADADPPGEAAAQDTAHRLSREGRKVKIARPIAGNDMNDALRELRCAR